MVDLADLETSSRLQRLLWTNEYVCLEDANVIIESFFVLEDSSGHALKMVRGGLCSNIFVLADCASRCRTVREIYHPRKGSQFRFDSISCQNEGLDDMELLWLLPLGNIHLTVSKKASRHGLKVLRLRFCSGQLYHLELAERQRASKIWFTWIQCLQKLNKHRRDVFHNSEHTLNAIAIHEKLNSVNREGSKSDDEKREYQAEKRETNVHAVSMSDVENYSQLSLAQSTRKKKKNKRQSLAMHIVEHFNDHMKQSTDTQATRGSAHGSLRHMQTWNAGGDVASAKSSTTSRPTTESEGSIYSNVSADRFVQQLNVRSLFRVCLCIGDYFGQFLFEAGTSGLPTRMASMSAMRHFIEVDDCNMDSDDIHFGFGIERDSLRHCSSLPCLLDGEASFVEDLKQVDRLTHKTSLVYLDLTNQNDEKQAHVINGHVMLISGEEYQLYKEVLQHRNAPIDLRFATARHPDVIREQRTRKKRLRTRRKAVVKITDDLQSKIRNIAQKSSQLKGGSDDKSLNLKKHKSNKKKNKIRSFFHRSRKSDIPDRKDGPRQSAEHAQIFEYVTDIEIDDVANELTVIDAELFLRIHESELVECVWLKEERHSKAPNVMACIDFFHRLSGIVVTEILLPILPRERAELLARFTRIAEKCLKLTNFNSTKAIVCALQSPAIQRLRDSWGCFQRMFPESFRLCHNIYHVMSDDVPSQVYIDHLREAMNSPPCLPFLGTFLKQVTEFYMRKREATECNLRPRRGQRSSCTNTTISNPSLPHSQPRSINIDETTDEGRGRNGKSQNILTKILSTTFHVNESIRSFFEGERESSSSSRKDSFFTVTSGSGTDSSVGISRSVTSSIIYCKSTSHMTKSRRRHIQSLIIDYAKKLAKESGETWNTKRAKGQANNWDLVFDEALDWSNLFKKVASGNDESDTPAHNFSNLKLIAEEPGTHGPSLSAIQSEYDLTSTLFHFQLCVVRFNIRTKNNVRDFLLKAHYNSDVDNFALSLRREPPTTNMIRK